MRALRQTPRGAMVTVTIPGDKGGRKVLACHTPDGNVYFLHKITATHSRGRDGVWTYYKFVSRVIRPAEAIDAIAGGYWLKGLTQTGMPMLSNKPIEQGKADQVAKWARTLRAQLDKKGSEDAINWLVRAPRQEFQAAAQAAEQRKAAGADPQPSDLPAGYDLASRLSWWCEREVQAFVDRLPDGDARRNDIVAAANEAKDRIAYLRGWQAQLISSWGWHTSRQV